MAIHKKRILKFIRNVAISIVVLAAMIVGIGVVYTWLTGKNKVPAAVTTVDTSTASNATLPPPVQPAANAQEGVSIQSLTSPVAPGDNASVIAQTNAGSWCTISVTYGTTKSTDSGLKAKTADAYGSVTWAWTVESSVPVGKWPATITCTRNSKSGVVIGDLVVTNNPKANSEN
jgi:hypothetical protein